MDENIKKYLKYLRAEGKYDKDLIKLLVGSCEKNEDGEVTAGHLLKLINERYAESKKNKT